MSDLARRLQKELAGRYSVGKQLGAGGMAVVFLGQDLRHDRKVALKVLRPELGVAVAGGRFLTEIRIAANLVHPNILPLFDSGEADGLLFYVMPFIEGESLRDRLTREKELPLSDALHIVRGAASALEFAHRRGVVHRDIKPENILLVEGEAIVVDFGIAKAVWAAGDEQLTATGIAVGTPTYMSPEQVSGERELDGRSDVYSLACVLYEMLAGTPPYSGPTAMAILARKMTDPVPSLTALRETVSPAVERAISRALEKTPADRFATATQFVEALAGTGALDVTTGSRTIPQATEAPPTSIAVLPFVTLSADPEDEFLGDGIAEELIHALTRVSGLRVVARTSAFVYKGKQVDVREIGKALGVGAVLDGSIRRVGKRLRVTTQLVNASDGYHLWSERYDRGVEDVFAVQDDIARTTVERLQGEIFTDEQPAVAAPAGGFRAYELYLRGRHAWNRRTEEGLRTSITLLRQAIQVDQDFALAYAALADALVTFGIYGSAAPDEVMPQAESAALAALELDESLAEALTALACVRAVYRWDWGQADHDFRRAIELNPRYATAYQWYAINCLTPHGRFADARAALAHAEQLDPISAVVLVSKGFVSYCERDYERADREYQAALARAADFAIIHYFVSQLREQQGQYREAVASIERAIDLAGATTESLAALARARVLGGEQAEAERLLHVLQHRSEERYVSPVLLSLVLAALGQTDLAFEELERACASRAPELIWLGVRPVFDPLAGDPRMERLRARVGVST